MQNRAVAMAKKKHGGWQPGQSGNPAGRAKKGDTLAEAMRDVLAQEHTLSDGSKGTGKKILAEAIWRTAVAGNPAAQRLVWNYLDGMPTQPIEHGGVMGVMQVEFDPVLYDALRPEEDDDGEDQ